MKTWEIINQQFRKSDLLKSAILMLAGIIAPFFIIPIVKIVGYSEVIEEILKALVVVFVLNNFKPLTKRIKNVTLFILSFGLSESLLYLNYACQLGNIDIFWQRIVLTIPMHIVTALIILFSALKNKKTIILGIIVSLVIHLSFNFLVSSI